MKLQLTLLFSLFACSIFSQNVGINVIDPSGRLHVKTNSSVLSPQLRITEEGDDYARFKLENTVHTGAYWDIAGKSDTITDDALLNFYFKNSINSGDRVTIRGNGNVGINTTNPLSKLDIRSLGNGSELLRFSTERPWVFKQTDSGVLSKLTLQSTVGDKIFNIVSADSSIVSAAFKTNDFSPATYLIPTKGRVGIGTYTPNARVAMEGHPTTSENILRVNVNYDGNVDLVGVDCDSYTAEGYGVGANFRGGYRGLRGLCNAGASTRLSIGVVGAATGTSNVGTRVGLWGNAYGGETNWAGYFDGGDVYVKNSLMIGSGAMDGATGYKVAIDGKVIAEELRINLSQDWPDYVFESTYPLMDLESLEQSIEEHRHLPGIPSAEEVKEEGLIVGDMQKRMMEKIEELTLYIIALNKDLKTVQDELESLKNQK